MTKTAFFSTKYPINNCYECDYDGDFEATEKGFKCPNCGNDNPRTS